MINSLNISLYQVLSKFIHLIYRKYSCFLRLIFVKALRLSSHLSLPFFKDFPLKIILIFHFHCKNKYLHSAFHLVLEFSYHWLVKNSSSKFFPRNNVTTWVPQTKTGNDIIYPRLSSIKDILSINSFNKWSVKLK